MVNKVCQKSVSRYFILITIIAPCPSYAHDILLKRPSTWSQYICFCLLHFTFYNIAIHEVLVESATYIMSIISSVNSVYRHTCYGTFLIEYLCISHNVPWSEVNIRVLRLQLRRLKVEIPVLADTKHALWNMHKWSTSRHFYMTSIYYFLFKFIQPFWS